MSRSLPRAEAVLRGTRVRLEPTTARHADDLWRAAEASLPELRPWLAWAVDADASTTRAFAEASEREWGTSSWTFTIFVGDEVAGSIGLNRYEAMLDSAEIGYWLRSDLAGRGLMSEAACLVVEFAFGHLGLHRLELHAGPENLGSMRIAEKLGFSLGGLLRHGSRGADGYYDVVAFDLLADDDRSAAGREPSGAVEAPAGGEEHEHE